MVFLFWILLLLAGVCFFLLMPSGLGLSIYTHCRGARVVTCPLTHSPASVQIDTMHAALTGMAATEKFRIASCALWPEREACAQGCLSDAVIAAPVPEPAIPRAHPTAGTRIHLPAYFVATAVFWLIGLFWYSQYLFRAWWMSLVGINQAQLRLVVELWSPHLITIGIAALFTFAITWVIALFDCHDVLRGMSAGFLLWLVPWVVTVGVVLFRHLPLDLIWLHGGYTLISCLASGALLGGWKKGALMLWLDQEEN